MLDLPLHMANDKKTEIRKHNKAFALINTILLLVLIFFAGVNQFIIAQTNKELGIKEDIFSQVIAKTLKNSESAGSDEGISLSGNIMDDAIKLVISQGVPEIYGEELGVDFGQAQASINIMRQYDPGYGKEKKITLTGDNLKRYTDVGVKISCEYCCGAKSIINSGGGPACGCAHSIAMRGLLAYLIQNHGEKYTNDELLRELARWKGIYFPKQMIKKLAEQLQGQKDFTPDTAALVLDVKLPEYEGGKSAPLPSEIENLPGMVGGC
jgi:hypothetical protein